MAHLWESTPPRTEPVAPMTPPEPLRFAWSGAWGTTAFDLLPDRAAYRPDQRTLYLADVHLGKPEHFRRRGAPVPEAVTTTDFERISALIASTGAERLVILGDLFHSDMPDCGTTMRSLLAWRERERAVRVLLVRGNHDRLFGELPREYRIVALDAPSPDPDFPDDPVRWTHEPELVTDARPHLAGHVHPGVTLPRGNRGTAFATRSRCFLLGPTIAVFPAFGRFTGMVMIHPERDDRVVVTNDRTCIDASRIFESLAARRGAWKKSRASRA